MAARIFYLLVSVFFVTMNVLLWRTDVTGRAEFGSRISSRLVWEKVLTAAGESALEIRYKGTKIGTARWQPSMTQAPSARDEADLDLPEGMIEHVGGYGLEFDGNCTLDESIRFRFGLHLKLSTNYNWQELSLRLGMRPHVWELSTVAAEQTLHLKIQDDNGASERVFKFSELQHPDKLLADLGQPWLPAALLGLGVPLHQRPGGRTFQLNWQARNEIMTVQHVHIRGYRLEAKLLDRHAIRIFINPAGEILRLDLPGEVVLLSESLVNL